MGKKLKIPLDDIDARRFLGVNDSTLRFLKKRTGARVWVEEDNLFAEGDETQLKLVRELVGVLKGILARRGYISEEDITDIPVSLNNRKVNLQNYSDIFIDTPKRRIYPKTANQAEYIKAIRENDIVVGIGPAGTGKTYLAVALAIEFLKSGKVEKLILTRPAVEAGESLGFLPGDLEEKINPYLTPLYDALYSMMGYERVKALIERRMLEIAPLAYMRGRTFHDAFVILDEAQNTKAVQMKMFLTRLGVRSKLVLTGDVTQIDLPHKWHSGLVEIQQVLKDIKGIKFVYFGKEDVIRHRLVKDIVEAYEKYQSKKKEEME